MTLLGKNSNNTIEKTTKNDGREEYRLPVVVEQKYSEMPFFKSFAVALLLHPLVVFLAWLVFFILSVLGIKFTLFEKPKMPQRDIEFVLVDKEGTPINKNTKYRSDRNSRAGGKHDPNRPVAMPQAPAPKGDAKSPQPKAPAPKKAEPPKQQVQQPKTPPKKVEPPKAQPKQQPKAPQPPKQQPKVEQPQKTTEAPKTAAPKVQAPRVSTQPPKAPIIADKPKTDFVIPTPKSAIPPTQPVVTAPIRTASGSGSGVNSGSSSGTSKGTASPSPSFSPSSGRGSGSSSGGGSGAKNGRFSGSGTGSGNVGNPGPGNPNGAPGIDAIKEPDFGPYMRELQKRIKMNWDPPKGNESKRVVLLFSISKDGRLLSIKVHKSSGLSAADDAAISAVKLTAPFKPLPAEFKGQSVDIQFTFDYNVFGASLN